MSTFNYEKHKSILLQILKDIYTDASIAPYLGFKGGTAAMLFYGLDRYSVDLDFDLLSEEKKKFVFQRLQTIASTYGVVSEAYIKRFSIFLLLSYATGTPKIKIEVNCRNFNSNYEIKTLLGISMQVMVKEDMFAHKLMAMIERIGKTSRDIYDIRFFAKKNWDINREIVEARAQKTYAETLQQSITLLENMHSRNILDGLGDLLTEAQKDSTRATLKEDALFALRLMLENEKQKTGM